MNLFEFIYICLELKRKNQTKTCTEMAADVAGRCHVATCLHARWQHMCAYVSAHVCTCVRVCACVCVISGLSIIFKI